MLNPAQHAAVHAVGHCLVAAGPGSGKTRVLSERGARLLQQDAAARLCAVTFTSDAAKELAHRMRTLAPSAGRRILHGTFHALCKQQLSNAGRRIKLVNDYQARDYLRRAFSTLADEGYPSKFDEFEAWVAAFKADPDAIAEAPAQGTAARGLLLYEECLQQNGVLDFADLIRQAVYGMRDGSVPPLDVQHLLIDEFQDTDAAQFAWMRCHLDAGVGITIVGDDDQSIYGWRQALGYSGMARFATLAEAEKVVLETTYRCARSIIRAASQLIVRNPERIPKSLITASNDEGEIRVEVCRSRNQEVQLIAERIEQSGAPERWAVLARTNALLDFVEVELGFSLPYTRSGAESFWSLKGPRLFLGLLKSLVEGDMVGIDALLGSCGVRPTSLSLLSELVRSKQPGAALRFIRQSPRGIERTGEKVLALRAMLIDWLALIDSGRAELAFHGMARFIAHNVWWGSRAKPSPDVIALELRKLTSCADRLARSTGSLAQIIRAAEQSGPADKGGARLMTLHSSKGLEFDFVWIMACEQGVLPSNGSPTEEERRLMYVGMTRARKELTLSYATEREAQPSEFLEQAGLFRL